MKKNVIMIVIDDLRTELNCFGKKKLHTPNIDALSAKGVTFERNYCQVPQCMPSRASMLSGVRPDHHVYHRIKDICPNGEPTLPGYFKENGYTTVSLGKIYHYNSEDEGSWDRKYRHTFYEQEYGPEGYCSGYQLEENKTNVKNYTKAMRAGRQLDPHKEDLPRICECADVPDSEYPDGKTSIFAMEELERLTREDKPFFLALGYYRPHLPWAVPKKYWDLYNREDVDLADNPFFPKNGICKTDLVDFMHYHDEVINSTYSDMGRYKDEDFPVLDEAKQRECVHAYWASVSFTDAQIGLVMNRVKELGIEKDTVIVLCSDNGWQLGEHKLWAKCTGFEESTRVPMIICDPSHPDSHGKTQSLTELLDIYPTLCDLCGLEKPAHLDGSSLVPVLEDRNVQIHDAAYSRMPGVFCATPRTENYLFTMRTKDYRLTYYDDPNPEGDMLHLPNDCHYELFDLKKDPKENVNVAEEPEYQEILAELAPKLHEMIRISK